MIQGLIGRKLGMTRVFHEDGMSIPVTIVEITPHYITQIRDLKKDGYCAVQVTTGDKSSARINKSEFGHFKKSGVSCGRGLWEFRVLESNNVSVGNIITINIFKNIKKVDITGISKGKGFMGTVKRWNFHMQDASHGNSLSHRAPGSIGQNQTPGKVFKGKKMAGHLGNFRVTIQNLDIINVDTDRNLLIVKGAVPGVIGGDVLVKTSIKTHSVREEI